ncbi:Rab32 [Hexamita inflata]|uniref:Putative n=1 Tax=Hexamita inflata TaxID=28002 RepID=A0AA86NRG2_9EUKA|nr:Rab32 [Hexamita inflata]
MLFIGPCGSGKTSIINKLVYNTFTNEYKITIGVDFSFKTVQVKLDDGRTVQAKVQLWDIAGQDRASMLTRSFYKDAAACLIIGDLQCQTMVFDVLEWKQDLDSRAKLFNTNQNIPQILLCNKNDLPEAEHNYQELEKDIKNLNLPIYKTSALTGEGLNEAFNDILKIAIKKIEKIKPQKDLNVLDKLSLDDQKSKAKGKCC